MKISLALTVFVFGSLCPSVHAQVYKSWAAATGFTGVPVTDAHVGLGVVSSASTSATSPMGGTGAVNSQAHATVGQLHVLAKATTDSLSLLVGDDQNFGFSGRDNSNPFDTTAPGFYATAAQFVVDDLVIAGAGVTTISANMDLHAILDAGASTALGSFVADSGFAIGFKVSQFGIELGNGTLKVSRDYAGATTNTGTGLLPALIAVTPLISSVYTTGDITVARGAPITMDWFLSAYGSAFTNGGNRTSGKADLNSTFGWTSAGPVFNIAGGGTASSAQGGISNNLFSGGASAPEPGTLVFLTLGATLVIVTRRHRMRHG